jgi:hypothetical protein
MVELYTNHSLGNPTSCPNLPDGIQVGKKMKLRVLDQIENIMPLLTKKQVKHQDLGKHISKHSPSLALKILGFLAGMAIGTVILWLIYAFFVFVSF